MICQKKRPTWVGTSFKIQWSRRCQSWPPTLLLSPCDWKVCCCAVLSCIKWTGQKKVTKVLWLSNYENVSVQSNAFVTYLSLTHQSVSMHGKHIYLWQCKAGSRKRTDLEKYIFFCITMFQPTYIYPKKRINLRQSRYGHKCPQKKCEKQGNTLIYRKQSKICITNILEFALY